MRGVRPAILAIILVLMIAPAYAYVYNVPLKIQQGSEPIDLVKGVEQTVGEYTLFYNETSGIYIPLHIKKGDSEWETFPVGDGGIGLQLVPEWTENVVLHVGLIGAPTVEYENYVTDDSTLRLWLNENDRFIASCGDYIDDPLNVGLRAENFYQPARAHHWLLESYQTSDHAFSYSFDINPDPQRAAPFDPENPPISVTRPETEHYLLNIYADDNFETPARQIEFEQCGDTRFTYEGREYLVQPFFYKENGNWYVAVREVTRECGHDANATYRFILGLYDDERQPLEGVFIKNAERFAGNSMKMDVKIRNGAYNTYIFDGCEWASLTDDLALRLSGQYGRDAEFEVLDGTGSDYPPVTQYRPVWDRILAALGLH